MHVALDNQQVAKYTLHVVSVISFMNVHFDKKSAYPVKVRAWDLRTVPTVQGVFFIAVTFCDAPMVAVCNVRCCPFQGILRTLWNFVRHA